MDPQALDLVESYVGGCGFVQDDLQRLANEGFDDDSFDNSSINHYTAQGLHGTIFALTQNVLNFMTAKADDQYEDELLDYGGVYPRTTQIIRLSEKADLVGALMDFDLSIVGCAYDGMDVRLTPRAAYSIVTLSQVVTPFTLEERRNLERISKVCVKSAMLFWLIDTCEALILIFYSNTF